MSNPEKIRLRITRNNHGWKTWGPYLSERQWGTVREDYSEHGNAWDSLTHDMARSKAYRWGEDGIAGISDNQQFICMAFAFWNGQDSILKERLFGLNNGEGNHGEDVKEVYYYLDSTPTHSYMKMLYKYPQSEFPYMHLVTANRNRTKSEPEYELVDTGIFDKDEYFDVFIEYAKADENDILIRTTVHNRSKKKAPFHLIPTLWFRNTWSWGLDSYQPKVYCQPGLPLLLEHREVGNYQFYYKGNPELLFCDNNTNIERFEGVTETNKYYKDGINNFITSGDRQYVNPNLQGTKAGLHYQVMLEGQASKVFEFRLSQKNREHPFDDFDEVFDKRLQEANLFYEEMQQKVTDPDLKNIQRQAYAGMMWNKQFYYYNVDQWIKGDPVQPKMPKSRKHGRNSRWRHLVNHNIISMPDKWEYPWYAAWDLAFHCVTLAKIDPEFAKRQLLLLLREYYMHPNGQIPAYEWSFSDVNPPVHAWGAWKVYTIDKAMNDGVGDTDFLAKVFVKLLMNFTWWVNQKDSDENNLFEGGFLGLDNIGVFDRNTPVILGASIEQADATGWMAMYSLNMLRISAELSKDKGYYQETASKFFEHFLMIAQALTSVDEKGDSLWDEEDEFYYDKVHLPHQAGKLLKVRSLVGLLPLFAVEVFSHGLLQKNPEFTRRLEFALKNRPDLANLISRWIEHGKDESRMLALVRKHRMKCLLQKMLDEKEFLSDFGVRALSKFHEENPYEFVLKDQVYSINYIPGESDSSMFGGNSNWRGPIWFPVNFMLLESLYKFYEFYGDALKFEYPTGSGQMKNLKEIARALTERLVNIFRKGKDGKRVVFGDNEKFQKDPHFKDYILFYEYFHGDSGQGLGASHQTGWTGLVANLIDDLYEK
ncbi:glucosidase [Rapidithrix thailandica]|uniref:Glucosidase n=1 Tax=Rapidithrix thailandica TaxID=413964 RepID=A0AAW9RTH6_9BACT